MNPTKNGSRPDLEAYKRGWGDLYMSDLTKPERAQNACQRLQLWGLIFSLNQVRPNNCSRGSPEHQDNNREHLRSLSAETKSCRSLI
jgi:hypothetical protein